MSHRRWLRLVLIVLVVAALPLTVALAQEGQTADSPVSVPQFDPEVEPNNSFEEANNIWGPVEAAISPARDKDYFSFYAYSGLDMAITITLPAGSKVKPLVILYSGSLNELARGTCPTGGACLTYRLPQDNGYYVRVTDGKNKGGNAYGYTLAITYVDPNEPNDTLAQATPFVPGTTVWGVIDSESDADFFSFAAGAGDEFHLTGTDMHFQLLGPNGEDLGFLVGAEQPIFKVKETGVHYLKNIFLPGGGLYSFWLRPVERPLLVSFATAGTLDGVAFAPGDAMVYSSLADSWAMYFDASDIGLNGNLVALDFAGGLVLTYDKAYKYGQWTVRPQDAMRFVEVSHGDYTNGYLNWEFLGRNQGLTTAGEAIDALADGPVYPPQISISTKGAASVPGATQILKAQKDDLLVFEPDLYGQGNDYWYTAINGATLNLQGANLIGLDDIPYGVGWYLLFDRPVTINGVAYDLNDVILCRQAPDGQTCVSSEEAFDSALFGGYRVDAIDVMLPEYE